MADKPNVMYWGLAGLGMAGVFFALQELFSSRSNAPAPVPQKLPAAGPIIIVPPRGIITGDDTHKVLACLRSSTGPVDLLIHAYGGYLAAVDPIVHAVREYDRGRVRACIPAFAFSGGTMVAIAADQILLGEGAVLGPVDPQIGGFAAADLIRLSQRKTADAIDDQTLLMADLAAKAYEETRLLVSQLVPAQAVERLTSGATSHANPITFTEAKALGLPVAQGVPEQYHRLLDGRLKRPKILWEL